MTDIKAFEIDLTDYIIHGTEHLLRKESDGETALDNDGNVLMGALYPVKTNMVEILMAKPAVGRAVMTTMRLATKIEDCTDGKLYLDKNEYKLLNSAFESFANFRPAIDGELAERVFDAVEVEMAPPE